MEDLAVLDEQHARGVAGRLDRVRDHEDGLAAAVDLLEQAQQLIRRARIERAGRLVAEQNIRIIWEEKEVTHWNLIGSPVHVKRILMNILSNAVKYTLKGTVTITVSEEKKLTVTDTGMGIAPEDLPRIFEKGYTGYNGRMERKSTGIGLYLSQMAAKKLGHQITVVSKLGEGSSFTIDLAEYPLRTE